MDGSIPPRHLPETCDPGCLAWSLEAERLRDFHPCLPSGKTHRDSRTLLEMPRAADGGHKLAP